MAISPDLPALKMFAAMAGVEPARLAEAFSDPARLFDHLTLEEVAALKVGCNELASLQGVFVAAMDLYLAYAKGGLTLSADPQAS